MQNLIASCNIISTQGSQSTTPNIFTCIETCRLHNSADVFFGKELNFLCFSEYNLILLIYVFIGGQEGKQQKNPQTLKNHTLKPPQSYLLLRFISSLEKLNKKGKTNLQPPNFHFILVLIFLVTAIQLIEQMNISKFKIHSRTAAHISSDNFVNEFDMINVISVSHCLRERHCRRVFYIIFSSSVSHPGLQAGRLVGLPACP